MATRKKKASHHELSDYEKRQVEKIAAWKGAYPNPFGELFHRIAMPIAQVVEMVIPDPVVAAALRGAYKISTASAPPSDICADAGVRDITELRHRSLEECDHLSRRVGTMAQGIATVEGVLTGVGGVWTTLLDVPLLLTLCVRTIIRNGHCYGYPLDRPWDEAWVLAAFALAISTTKERRTLLRARLREIEDLVLEETQENIVIEETASLIGQIEVFEDIPVVGAVTGGLLNLATAHRADVTARHLFQERWLRDNGKVTEIEPAEAPVGTPALEGLVGNLARVGRSTIYGVSFGLMAPLFVLGAVTSPLTVHVRKGAAAGINRLRRGLRGAAGADGRSSARASGQLALSAS